MRKTTRLKFHRLLAALMVLAMLLSYLPANSRPVSAATQEHPDVMTMTVTDGSKPVPGATVRIYTTSLGENSFDLSKTTDENGLVVLEEITRIALEQEEAFPFYYIITAEGYETSVCADSMEAGKATVHINATVVEKEKATLTVGLTGGDALVTINGEQCGTKTAYVGSELEVVVTPAENYYISAIRIGTATATPPVKGEAFRCTLTIDQDTMILVTLVREYKVSSQVSEGGSLYLNGAEQTELVADVNSTVTMKVVAAAGYRIDSIFIGKYKVPDVLNLSEYETDFILTEDTEITVTFIHIWTVTVTHKGDGTVVVDPAAEGGSVTVLSGTTVKITATPNTGFRVSGVVINGQADASVTGENDSSYYKELIADREYKVEITFAPNIYQITAKATANGTIAPEASSVEHGGSVKVHLTPLSGYTVDTVRVNGQVVTALAEEGESITFLIENITAHQEISVTFKPIAVANIKYLDIDVSDVLRIDEDKRIYVLKEGDSIRFTTTARRIRIYDNRNNIIATGNENVPVEITGPVTVARVGLYYKDNNEFFSNWHYSSIDPMTLVVDKGDNVRASLTAAFQPNAYGYYNKDIPFTVQAEDTGDYSGIALIQAWVACNGVKGAVQTLYSYDGGQILSKFTSSDSVVVNAAANSSKDVRLCLRVVDRAGNETTAEKALKIATFQPTVELSITGTQNQNTLPGYYNSNRVLTITVRDRADTFLAESIARGLKLYFNGEARTVDTSAISWHHDGNIHTGTYTFSDNGSYSWSLSYTNKADLSPAEITAPTDKDIYSFTIDKEAPYDLEIRYEPGFVDAILEGLTFGFYQSSVKVVISAKDQTSGIHSLCYSYTPDANAQGSDTGAENVLISAEDLVFDGNRATAEFTIPPQFRGRVSFTATDEAGHSATLTEDARILVVDNIAPGITVEYDDTPSVNGLYYNTVRTATIRIEESNFFHEDLEDGYLVLKVSKQLSDGSVKEELWKPDFTKDGSSYVAQIQFSEDADYTFDSAYTDRSGNIFDSYEADSFTVDLTKPEIRVSFDNNNSINDNHFMAARTATITVTEHNFRASDVICTVTENGEVSDYFTAYLQKEENWTHNGNEHSAKLLFSGGYYFFQISYTDLAGHENTPVDFGISAAPQDFVVDTGAPIGLKISYAPTFVSNVLEALTFGFYQAPVEVTIEATDHTAGVDYFTYSYSLQENVSNINSGRNNVVIPSDRITYDGAHASASFTIPAQFRGYVSFTATDRSGHSATLSDEKVVVVDTVAPGITVSYDNLNAYNGKYFDADRTATISIEEANFFPQDVEDGLLKITVSKTDNEGQTETTLVKPQFTKNGDVYTAKVSFTENADYTFDISYTDRAGNVFDSYAEDSFTIDKIAPQLTLSYDKTNAPEGYYFGGDVTLHFTIEEHNFRAEDMVFEISATDITGSKNVDLSHKSYEAYLRNPMNWTQAGDIYTAEITLDAEGRYRICADYADLALISQGDAVEATLCIDKSNPYDLAISYEPGFVGTLLEALTFGFYQAPVTVTIEAKDDFSGIDRLIYSYTVQDGAHSSNSGKASVTVQEEDLVVEGNRASYSFTVPAQFRGNVSFKAVDKALWENSLRDEQILVVDDVAPGITVSFDNMNAVYGNYYDADRTATITVQEANFFPQDVEDGLLKITVGKTLKDGSHSVTNPKPQFTKVGSVYTAQIHFTENADYSFDISYTDRSGNIFDSYAEEHFTVDKVRPEILVTYDNNDARNGNLFRADRTATIAITEHNFRSEEVLVKITSNGKTVDSYTKALQEEAAWTKQGDIYVATITFTEEAHYTFDISCRDMSGQWNAAVSYGNSVAPNQFTIDKETPYGLEIRYEPGFVDTILEGLTFGFYQAPVKVIISAEDRTSGLESFTYSYTPDANTDGINEGMENVLIPTEQLHFEGKKATAEFTVPPQFRGKVSFTATDRTGHCTTLTEDNRTLIVDSIAPGITVEYDETPAMNGSYYSKARSAKIRIEEANFFREDLEEGYLVLKVSKTYADGSVTEELLKPDFTKEGSSYVAQLSFAEDADYTFDIAYTDRAGNVFDSYPGDSFTVDLIQPEIRVTFDNNECINSNHFMAVRTATVTVIEHNFRASDVICTVTENGQLSDSYTAYLMNDGNWTHNGDVHTAKLLFSGGIYSFDLRCTDLAGHENVAVDFGNSVAPQDFVVDTGAPEDLKISYTPAFMSNILEAITFGFYKAPVTVTLEATDYTAGVDYFTYSYSLQDNVSDINSGMADVVIPSEEISYDGAHASASFTIPPQFRGYVSFTATDRSGHSASLADEKVVVVDTVAPGITVSYDNLNAYNGNYFDADRTATVTIEEANFFPMDLEEEYLKIMVSKTDNEGNTESTLVKPSFTKNGDIYTAEISFTENADYTFDISYTDRAGNVFDSYEEDRFTIDKIPPRLTMSYDKTPAAEGYYFKENVTLHFTVEEHNFRAEDMIFEISATDVTGSKTVDLSHKGYEAYLRNQNNWICEGNTYSAQITLDAEGNYQISADYTDLAMLSQGDPVEATLCIDKSNPYDLEIRYEPGFVATLLEALTFGFYQAPVTVTIEAKDDYSGIDRLIYSYAVQEGASEINSGKTTVIIHEEDLLINGNTASYSFTVPAQFRGNVSFQAIDKALWESNLTDEQILVVDNVAPGITVSYDNMSAVYDSYYSADRTATITINEANFFPQDIEDGLLKITVGKTLNDGTYSVTNPKPAFSKNGDVYTAQILFGENADYTFDISYTDRSGNVFDSYPEDRFTVDKIRPEIRVSYDNNSARNGDQFQADRTATISITEHNFLPSDVTVSVTANGSPVESYTQTLQQASAWTKNGDIYTAVISYNEEAHYTFDIRCNDMAGQENLPTVYGDSVAPRSFTIDKTAPTELTMTVQDRSVLGNNSVAFDTFYQEQIVIRLSAKFDISGMEAMEYQKVDAVSRYSPNGQWEAYNETTGIVIAPSEKLVLYFRATDRAGNFTIVNSTGIVVDDQMPTGEVNAPAIDILPAAANANGLHKGNVSVQLKVLDPKYLGSASNAQGYYSGLKNVSYRIYTNDTAEVESGILMDIATDRLNGAVKDADGLISSWSGAIEINANRFNSNQVMVEITAEDNAGNVRTTTTKAGDIRIDITAPRIDVSYSNNSADNGTFFKDERVATVTITERNFEASQVRISLSNRSGATPTVSGWSRTPSAGNGDGDRWVATIRYSNDGDYQFDISYTDQAGNAAGEANYGNSVAPKAFTVDRTLPAIRVSYDNNEVFNRSYYQKERTATIVLTEKNLDPNSAGVKVTLTAVQDGNAIALPTVSSWHSNGTEHTATVSYVADAVYSFDITVTDKAGNQAIDFPQESFCVDKTAPELNISRVEDGAAYAGEIAPYLSFSDVNFDPEQVEITLTSANRGSLTPNGQQQIDKKGGSFRFANFPEEKEQDDIYTLSAKITDAAGNATEQTLSFSVNRFGSAYEMSEDVQALNGSYVQQPTDIVITETNVDELVDFQVTLFKNNETIVLEEGKDFTVEEVSDEKGWYQYIYTIFAENFADDGVYKISVRSEDKAGNVSENFLDTKNSDLSFGVDKTAPTVVVQNLESGSTYAVEILDVLFSANDNLLLDSVAVYLDDMTAPLKTWNAEQIAQLLADRADFTFPVSGDSTEAHSVKFLCKDAAGNETVVEVDNFYVTTNILVRYWNNKGLFFGSIGGVLALAAGLIVLLAKKKKKEQ